MTFSRYGTRPIRHSSSRPGASRFILTRTSTGAITMPSARMADTAFGDPGIERIVAEVSDRRRGSHAGGHPSSKQNDTVDVAESGGALEVRMIGAASSCRRAARAGRGREMEALQLAACRGAAYGPRWRGP